MEMDQFKIQFSDFKILSTGNDGGHKYITTRIMYEGMERSLTVFFANKSDEQKVLLMQTLNISGQLIEDGPNQTLILFNAVLVAE